MSFRIRLIEWLGGVDKATYLGICDAHASTAKQLRTECDAHTFTQEQLADAQKTLGNTNTQLENANTQLATMQDEYVAYQDEQQAKDSDAVIAYRELLIAVMKANLQKAKGSAWKLNQLTRYPNKIADVIRAEFRRHYPDSDST